MNRYFLLTILISIVAAAAVAGEREIKIKPAKPTHYFYTPMPDVNPAYCLEASLHEASFSLPDRLQVQASLFDNIGRVNFGAKYGITRDCAVGAGLAHSILHMGDGAHGIPSKAPPRFGLFLCYRFVETLQFEAVITPHMQLFDHNSLGCDFGGMWTPSDMWSIIWEVGTSMDVNDHNDDGRTHTGFYFNTDGGLRVRPPSLPFLSFDGGIDVQEFKVNRRNAATSATIYVDAIFAMKVK
jgi:hypothetical protein